MATHFQYDCAPLSDLSVIPHYFCRDHRLFWCHADALPSLISLCETANDEGIQLVVISAFRDIEFQTELYQDAQRRHGIDGASEWVAPPGHSEHHTGFAFDFADFNHPEFDDESGFETTPAGQWLIENAPNFGFTLSFPLNNSQGVGYEPWHWKLSIKN